MHEGHRERVRERFAATGLDGFAPHEVLEFLLFFAIPKKDVNPLAHTLLSRFGSIGAVLDARAEELMQVSGIGRHAATLITFVSQMMRYCERERYKEPPLLTSYTKAGEYCTTLLRGEKRECVYLLCLDSKGRLIQSVKMHEGTIDESSLYPREIVREALMHNAFSVLLAHNHPGGDATPSINDFEATRSVINALRTVQIQVMDHIIVGEQGYGSMAYMRMINQGAIIDKEGFESRLLASRSTDGRAVSQIGEMEKYYGFPEA